MWCNLHRHDDLRALFKASCKSLKRSMTDKAQLRDFLLFRVKMHKTR